MSVRGLSPSELGTLLRFGPPLPTGIPNLDETLEGGLLPATVSALVGPPFSGKTGLLSQIGLTRAEAGNYVGFLLADEDWRAVLRRLCALSSGWAAETLRNLTREDVVLATGVLDRLKIHFWSRPTTFAEFVEAFTGWCPADAQGIVLLDSVQRIKPSHVPIPDKQEQVNELLDAIEDATRRFNWLTVFSSKATRESYSGQRPVNPLATGGESSYIESNVDTVIRLSGDIDQGVKVEIPKNRDRGPGECFLVLDRSSSRFRPLLEAERTARQATVTTARAAKKEAKAAKKRAVKAVKDAEKARQQQAKFEAELRKSMQEEARVVEAIERSPGATSAAISRLAGLSKERFKTVTAGLLPNRVRVEDLGRGRGRVWFPVDSEVS